ncbi:hypothetical protein EJ05DRAFT_489057 [Pseudovirgaria hyperparasitica]|uniref:Uncharacterized protein n=1 Tax=Pseudovirgaria hyperparasitica TaxID=470096 RepID=A0A6A6VYL7_9PEZI|nr:uncharacterized protein EJ05DRAFT_489057 [Pseudovirgaria hyperparasitica]KAF2754926.1 hypothetical protein EJ05DRAFT_489057 [Pseudovirgaria hyperparasitica]
MHDFFPYEAAPRKAHRMLLYSGTEQEWLNKPVLAPSDWTKVLLDALLEFARECEVPHDAQKEILAQWSTRRAIERLEHEGRLNSPAGIQRIQTREFAVSPEDVRAGYRIYASIGPNEELEVHSEDSEDDPDTIPESSDNEQKEESDEEDHTEADQGGVDRGDGTIAIHDGDDDNEENNDQALEYGNTSQGNSHANIRQSQSTTLPLGPTYCAGKYGTHEREFPGLDEYMDEDDILDMDRILKLEEEQFSWQAEADKNLGLSAGLKAETFAPGSVSFKAHRAEMYRKRADMATAKLEVGLVRRRMATLAIRKRRNEEAFGGEEEEEGSEGSGVARRRG